MIQRLVPYGVALTLVCVSLISTSCGPSCPETLGTYGKLDLYNNDVSRVNRLVTLRTKAMDAADQEKSGPFRMERIRFSVTALELAIEIQVQTMILASEYADDEIVAKRGGRLVDIRCLIEEYAAQDEFDVSDSKGKKLLDLKAEMDATFGKTGLPSRNSLEKVFTKGLAPKKAEEKEEDKKASEDDESASEDGAESGDASQEEDKAEDKDPDSEDGETNDAIDL